MYAVWCFTDGTCHLGGRGSRCSFILRFYLLLSSLLFAFLSLISVNPMSFSCLFDWMMPRLNPLFVVAFVSFSASFQSSHDSKVSWLWVLVSESKLSLEFFFSNKSVLGATAKHRLPSRSTLDKKSLIEWIDVQNDLFAFLNKLERSWLWSHIWTAFCLTKSWHSPYKSCQTGDCRPVR